MKRFVLTVGEQSLAFTAGDVDAMQAALSEAVERPGQPARHTGASGPITATLYTIDLNGERSQSLVQTSAGAVRMTDQKQDLTDC